MSAQPDHDPVAMWAGRVRVYQRKDRHDPEKLAEARRNLAEAKLERAIQEAVDGAPPLSDEACDRLAALLTRTGLRKRVVDALGAEA